MMKKSGVLLLCMLLCLAAAAPAAADVIVFGGTGQLGARIVRLMLDAGEEVTVFARTTSDRARLDGLAVEYAIGDVLEDSDVAAAFRAGRYRTVIIAVRAPLSEAGFYGAMSRHIVAHAPTAGVEQIIYHGAVGAGDNMALHPEVPWSSVPGLVERMQDQGVAEATFLGSDISATIIRNSRVYPEPADSTGQAELTIDQRTLTPITRADLALLTMYCVDNDECADKIFHARDETLKWPPPGE